MIIIFAVLVFVWGIVLGSAGNALIDRLPKNLSWAKGRSKCDKCKHTLHWQDLIPVVSYVQLGGKCRYCHFPIPIRNLVVELITGVGFLLIFNITGPVRVQFLSQFTVVNFLNMATLMGIFWVTVVIAVMDWETQLVSEILVMVWGGLALLRFLVLNGQLSNNLTGLIVGVGTIGGVWLITRGRAMGEGDIEIAAVMGWWLGGINMAIGLWMAFILGSVVGVYKLIKKTTTMKSEIAFGPFLVAGAWIGFWWGEKIWRTLFG